MNIQPRPNKDGMAWRLRWEIRDPATGERRQVSETVAGTKDAAKKRWREKQGEIDKQGSNYSEPSKQLLADYLREWLAAKAPDLERTTASGYRDQMQTHVIPVLGATELRHLAPKAIQAMLDAMRNGTGPEGRVLSTRTCQYTRSILRNALQDSVRLGSLPSNPVDRTKGPKQEPRKVKHFEPDDGYALFERAESTGLANLFRFAYFSGLRRGEILGLQWGDVDLSSGLLTVRRARVPVHGKDETQGVKTEAGERSFTLPALAIDPLRAQRLRQIEARLKAGEKWQDGDWIFTTKVGKPLNSNNVSRDLRRLRDAVGLPKLPLHALRHSAASVQLAAGVALDVVSKRLGHKRVSTTSDVYGHLLKDADQEAARKVDEFMAKRGTKGSK